MSIVLFCINDNFKVYDPWNWLGCWTRDWEITDLIPDRSTFNIIIFLWTFIYFFIIIIK